MPDQLFKEHLGNSHSSGTGTKGQEGLVGDLFLGDVHRTEDPGQGYDSGSLNIIVEGQNLILVLIEDLSGGSPSEVLKVEQAPREEAFNFGNEAVNEGKVLVTPDPFLSVT